MSEENFQIALEEIESGDKIKGLWAQCFAEMEGDEAKTKAAYIKKRAGQLAAHQRSPNDLLSEKPIAGTDIKWQTTKAIMVIATAYALSYFALVYYYFLTAGGVPAKLELYALIPTAWFATNLAKDLARHNGVNELLNMVCLLFIPIGWIILFLIPPKTDKLEG